MILLDEPLPKYVRSKVMQKTPCVSSLTLARSTVSERVSECECECECECE